MKFLLVKPGKQDKEIKNFMLDPTSMPPLGLLYLGAVLEQEGHNVEILDFYMENITKEKLKKALMSSDAVGMSIYTDFDFKPYVDTSKLI